MKSLCQKDTCTSIFITVLFTKSKICDQPYYPSVDEWENVLYLHKGMFSHKYDQNPVICSNMDGTGDHYVK
jgi:hypothetical protein